MNLPNHRMLRKGVIAFIAAGLFWGVDGINAQAETGYITVTDRNEKITKDIHYEGETGEDHPVSVVFLPENVSNGTITVAPENHGIEGIFTTGGNDKTGMTVNAAGILLQQGYVNGSGSDKGYEKIPGYEGHIDIAAGTSISVTGKGERLNGAAIHSSLTPAKDAPYATIQLGKGNTLSYTLEGGKAENAVIYGLYNEHTAINADKGLKVYVKGNMGEAESGNAAVKSSAFFNYEGSRANVGDNYEVSSDFTAAGKTVGIISGVDSGRAGVADPVGNQLDLGNDGRISVSFTGKGGEDDTSPLDILSFYTTQSTFTIKDRNTFTAALGENSSARYVSGMRLWPGSHGTIGDDFTQNVNVGDGSHVQEGHGLYAFQSELSGGNRFHVIMDSHGFVNESDGVNVNTGRLTLRNDAVISNDQSFEGNDAADQTRALYAYKGNVTMGDNAALTVTGNRGDFTHVYGAEAISSDVITGEGSQITASALNRHFDGNSEIYGAYVWGNGSEGIFTMGENGKIEVNGENAGTIGAVSATTDGKVILKYGNILSASGSTSEAGQAGSVYGLYSTYGTIEGGNHITVTANGKGYDSYGLYNRGYDESYKGMVTLGDHLTVIAESDAGAYGIQGDGSSDGTVDGSILTETVIGKDATISAKGKEGYGVLAIGGQNEMTLDEGAVITAEGENSAVGAYSSGGAHIKFKGKAAINTSENGESGEAVYSKGNGSLVDLTGRGQKVIFGDLFTSDNGKIDLAMNTGDSLLTGASYVDGGSTNISMENGALWHMTDDSHLTSLSLKSGATIDMEYNKDYQKLTVDHFDGNGGVFYMKSDLASQTDGDKVHIKDAANGAKGFISVYDKSLVTGKEVTGARHLLMVTDGSGKASFYGKSLSTGGLWDITPTIQRGGTFTEEKGETVGRDDEWYLTKVEKKTNEAANTVMKDLSNNYGLYRQSIDTLRQRLGDLRYDNRKDRNDFWVRNIHGRYAGSGYDSKYHFLQLGMDTKANDKSYYGFFIERGIASSDFYQGSGKDHTLAGALYATWLGNDGSYTDIVAKAGRNDGTVRTYENNDSVSYREQERSLSVEYGRTIPFGNKGYFAEPEIQLILGHLGSSAFTTEGGTRIHQDAYDSAIGRVGAIIGRKESAGTHPYDFYLKVSLLHEFGGDRAFTLSRTNNYGDEENVAGRDSYKDTWVEAGFGGTLHINSSTYLYADAEKSFGADFTKKWQFNVGIRWTF